MCPPVTSQGKYNVNKKAMGSKMDQMDLTPQEVTKRSPFQMYTVIYFNSIVVQTAFYMFNNLLITH